MPYASDLADTTPLVRKKANSKPLSALTTSLAALCLVCGAVVARNTISPSAGNSGKQLDTTSLTTDAVRGPIRDSFRGKQYDLTSRGDPVFTREAFGNYSLDISSSSDNRRSWDHESKGDVLIKLPGDGGPILQTMNLGQELVFELECERSDGGVCSFWKVDKAVYDSCDPSGNERLVTSGNGGGLGYKTTLWDYACLGPGPCSPPVDYYTFTSTSGSLADGCRAGLKVTVTYESPPVCEPEKEAYAACYLTNCARSLARSDSRTPLAGPFSDVRTGGEGLECTKVGDSGANYKVCSLGSYDALHCSTWPGCRDESFLATECVTQYSLQNYQVDWRGSPLPGKTCDCNCMCRTSNTCTAGDPPAEPTPLSQCTSNWFDTDAACKTSAGLFAAAAGVAAAAL